MLARPLRKRTTRIQISTSSGFDVLGGIGLGMHIFCRLKVQRRTRAGASQRGLAQRAIPCIRAASLVAVPEEL